MEYRILGPLQVLDGDRDITPTAPKLRGVLALLLTRPNEVIHTQQFIDELWGEGPPPTALSTLQTYIYKLRKMLTESATANGEELLLTRPNGYVIATTDEQLDLCAFERLSSAGRGALEAGDPETARVKLTEALGLWRGRALADIDVGELLSAYVTRLEEDRFRVLELRIEADLQVGRHQEVISELKGLAHMHRLHEGLHAKLMVALQRSGRRHEALEVYQQLRRNLIEELGLEPSPTLRSVQQAVLSFDAEPEPAPPAPVPGPAPARAAPPPSGAPSPSSPPAGRSAPRELPPDIVDFTGRAEVLERIEAVLDPPERTGDEARVVVISGLPGVGKTALAVRAANRLRERYPDGQLYVDLQGHHLEAHPFDVLGQFLTACDLELPDAVNERGVAFQRWCADREVLVVLDNAASPEQIVPLLPRGPGCGVIVTGRSPVVAGQEMIALDVPPLAEAVEMLGNFIGRRRVAEERTAAENIVHMCGRLPLALRSVASRLAAAPGWPLSKLVGQLATMRTRLDELCFSDLDVRSGFAASYDRLDERARIVAYRLVSLLQSSEFAPPEAAALFGCDDDVADTLLGQMVEKHLLRVLRKDAASILHEAFNEIARSYAGTRAGEELTADVSARET